MSYVCAMCILICATRQKPCRKRVYRWLCHLWNTCDCWCELQHRQWRMSFTMTYHTRVMTHVMTWNQRSPFNWHNSTVIRCLDSSVWPSMSSLCLSKSWRMSSRATVGFCNSVFSTQWAREIRASSLWAVTRRWRPLAKANTFAAAAAVAPCINSWIYMALYI